MLTIDAERLPSDRRKGGFGLDHLIALPQTGYLLTGYSEFALPLGFCQIGCHTLTIYNLQFYTLKSVL